MKFVTSAVAAAVLAATSQGYAQGHKMSHESHSGVTHHAFGKTKDGHSVEQYVLTTRSGATAKIITFGATLTELHVADKHGKLSDVVLGFDKLTPYESGSPYFGATVGRVGNRIANGKFTVDGKEYHLAINNGPNSLHGGLKAFDKRIWKAEVVHSTHGPAVKFTLHDADGTEGYPGNVDVSVVYTLTNHNSVHIEYTATTDKATPLNLTNHSYFNLKDAGKTDMLGHVAQINATRYTVVDSTLIPTGELAPVKGTPIDFTHPKPIGKDLKAMGGDPAGFDHNMVLRDAPGALIEAAVVTEPTTGRKMEVWTTEPGVQFYTGNFLDGKLHGKHGAVYKQYHGFCLETQHFPDSVNQPKFPTTIVRPGKKYHTITEYRFSVVK